MKILNIMDEEFKEQIDNNEFFGEGLEDVFVLAPDVFGDVRGFFSPAYIKKYLEENIPFEIFNGVEQQNFSNSQKGVIRGLHYQLDPKCQTKLVSVIKGEAIDVIVDIRPDSPTFKKWFGIRLKPFDKQLLVPKGFAHGFIALQDDTLFHYLVDNDYAPKMEDGIPWDDKSINIDWETIFKSNDIHDLITSEKDKLHSTLDEKLANGEITFKRSDLSISKRYYNSRTKVLVTGGAGQLGYDVIKELNKRGYKDIYAPTIDELDLTKEADVNKAFEEFKPDLVIHCAAYTAVDKAEDDFETAHEINVDATRFIAQNCEKLGSKLIYISTDYVFDGTKNLDLTYDVNDIPKPISVYGKTKLMGEREALNNPKTFIVRTSWVFGINGKNFMKAMLKASETNRELSVVSDQYGSPTYTVDLARLLVDMAETNKYGLYHANNEGYCNWAEFAEEIFRQNDKDVLVHYVTTDEYYAPQFKKAKEEGIELHVASRPKNSKLSKNKLIDNGFDLLPSWKDAVRRYSRELKLKNEELENLNKPKTL
jgi:dTDP-4-dehydrorhamnose reductase/dTDP-4-dehydrorhamnose 3,5-epimerase